ncbi:hypothetical protein [Mucilaginibacter xinganensis]|uniref:Lipocalin-like domain-containing protein n=1 Tax=Mucilaginibacter xinganensis TaxID=1234841 RepID=A0A223P048_9SPHI|nr:hypothetical protein [Mucilaginibacter xinganensis]ASU35493.1 hypothetical protein MuYL_3608 [Mucilaginibacter xinganensis]
MKKIILTLGLLVAIGTATFAQCDKSVVLNSSKTDHLDADGKLTRSEDESAMIEISKTTVDVSINGEHKIAGIIKSTTCDWKVPFKEGKTVIKASTDRDGQEKTFTMTIEGKDGKVTLYFEMEGEPNDKVRVGIDKFVAKA